MKQPNVSAKSAFNSLFSCCLLIFFSCTKNSDNPNGLKVYATGYSGGAKYWVNGSVVNLVDGQYAISTCITVSGADVFVAGFGSVSGSSGLVPQYWKNNKLVDLTDGTNGGYESSDAGFYGRCIAVSGSDVYVAGYVRYFGSAPAGSPFPTKTAAKYWKNGTAVTLSDTAFGSANATCIAVSGTDVYVAGMENSAPTYWKNGVAVKLADSSKHAGLSAITVSGSDVYVSGSEEGAALYWKNGSSIILADSSQHIVTTSIAVSGADVYVSGYKYNGLGPTGAVYWKNGTLVDLIGGNQAFDIAISNDDVYVAGADISIASGGTGAKIWKNGMISSLAQGNQAFSIFLTN